MYLLINSREDCCSNSHTNDKPSMEVLMEEHGLTHCHREHEDGVEIALPDWLCEIVSVQYNKPEGGREEGGENIIV